MIAAVVKIVIQKRFDRFCSLTRLWRICLRERCRSNTFLRRCALNIRRVVGVRTLGTVENEDTNARVGRLLSFVWSLCSARDLDHLTGLSIVLEITGCVGLCTTSGVNGTSSASETVFSASLFG